MLGDALQLEAWADNDANAVAIGEHIFGNARDYDHFSSIVLGRTIGSAHYMHGILNRGHDGSAGEIGHITVDPGGRMCRCGRNGCLDTIAGASHCADRRARTAWRWMGCGSWKSLQFMVTVQPRICCAPRVKHSAQQLLRWSI
jgi:predicted NBD/HSP70 family sugar kinase